MNNKITLQDVAIGKARDLKLQTDQILEQFDATKNQLEQTEKTVAKLTEQLDNSQQDLKNC